MLNSHLFYAGFILADPSDNCDIYKIISKNHQANSQCLKITSIKSHFTTFCKQSELRFFIMKLEPYFPHFSRLIICLRKWFGCFFSSAIFLTDFFSWFSNTMKIQGWNEKVALHEIFSLSIVFYSVVERPMEKFGEMNMIRNPSSSSSNLRSALCFSFFFPGFWHTLIMWPKTPECPGWCSTIPETLKV